MKKLKPKEVIYKRKTTMKPFNEEACNYILYFCREAKEKGYQELHIELNTQLDKYPNTKFEDIPYTYYQAKEVISLLAAKGLHCAKGQSSTIILWEYSNDTISLNELDIKYDNSPLPIHITPVINSKLPDQWDEGVVPRYQDLEIVLGNSGDIESSLTQEVLTYLAEVKGWTVTNYITTDEYGNETLANPEAHLISTLSLSHSITEDDIEFRLNPDVIEAVEALGSRAGEHVRVERLRLPADKQWFITYDSDSTDSSEYLQY